MIKLENIDIILTKEFSNMYKVIDICGARRSFIKFNDSDEDNVPTLIKLNNLYMSGVYAPQITITTMSIGCDPLLTITPNIYDEYFYLDILLNKNINSIKLDYILDDIYNEYCLVVDIN